MDIMFMVLVVAKRDICPDVFLGAGGDCILCLPSGRDLTAGVCGDSGLYGFSDVSLFSLSGVAEIL